MYLPGDEQKNQGVWIRRDTFMMVGKNDIVPKTRTLTALRITILRELERHGKFQPFGFFNDVVVEVYLIVTNSPANSLYLK